MLSGRINATETKQDTHTANTTRKLDILGHDCHTLGVDGTQVCIFKETDEVGLRSFLQGQDSSGLETEIRLEILGDLTNQTLEGSLADEKVCGLLVLSDLTESHSSWSVPVGLLDSSGGGSRLAGSLKVGAKKGVRGPILNRGSQYKNHVEIA